MPDVLTAAEQAAIESYRGPVQRIPRGVSGEELPVWTGHALRDPTYQRKRWGYHTPPSDLAKRRQKVRQLRDKGWTLAEIAKALGVSVSTVSDDARVIREAA